MYNVSTPEQRAECVKRYRRGERVRVLSKFYGVSLPAVYQWLTAAKVTRPMTREHMLNLITDLHARVDRLESASDIAGKRL